MRRHLLILLAVTAAALSVPSGAFAACSGAETQPNAENLDQIAPLDVEHHFLESDATVGLERFVLYLVPTEVFHRSGAYHPVCL